MGVKRLREDSVKELSKQKTRRQLQEENEQLRAKVESLEGQVTDTQMALCDVYEAMMGGADMAKVYADLIRKGLKTIDDVPARLRAEVTALLQGADHE